MIVAQYIPYIIDLLLDFKKADIEGADAQVNHHYAAGETPLSAHSHARSRWFMDQCTTSTPAILQASRVACF